MNLYIYRAIITKVMYVALSSSHDNPLVHTTAWAPLDSVVATGNVLGEDEEKAKKAAIAEVKRRYPEEQGYKDHGNITVSRVYEEVICVSV